MKKQKEEDKKQKFGTYKFPNEEKDKMVKKEEVGKEYKNKVVFLRRSKAGNHLFVHDSREDLIPGGTLILNVSEVVALIKGEREWLKVGILPPETEAEGSAAE